MASIAWQKNRKVCAAAMCHFYEEWNHYLLQILVDDVVAVYAVAVCWRHEAMIAGKDEATMAELSGLQKC